MQEIIGVKFRNASKVYYFDPKDLDIHYNDHVIVETVRGIEFGTVVLAPMMLADDKVPQPLREVLRIADAQDVERETENRIKEKEAFKICRQKILERGLEMKLIQAEYTFDNSKVLFYFTPYIPERVRAGLHQDGQGTEPVPEPDQNIGLLRTSHVLSEK